MVERGSTKLKKDAKKTYEAFTCFTGTKVQILTQKATGLAMEVKKTHTS